MDIGVEILGIGGWKNIVSVPVADVTYNELLLGEFKMHNAQADAVGGGNSSLSVFSYVQKNNGDVTQIPLLDSATPYDISAFTRAEVFYWDPDRRRSERLRRFRPAREPNLFNPFWHARLAPVNQALDFLPAVVTDILPITH